MPAPRRTRCIARLSRVAALLAFSSLAACHGDPTGLRDSDPAAVAARLRFIAIADSLSAAGSDPAVVNAYAGIAASLAWYAHVTPVRVTVDGSADEWLATAREIGMRAMPCPSGALCAPLMGPMPLVSVVAWQRSDPRRVVQLTTTGPRGTFAQVLESFIHGAFLDGATLTYLDGRGGVFGSPNGTQEVLVSHSARACATATVSTVSPVSIQSLPNCTIAGMHTTFSATVLRAPELFSPRGNTASGEHRLEMTGQDVDGTRLDLDACATCYAATGYPPSLLPPVNFRGTIVLPATLRYTVDSVVTLTLDVVNDGAVPAELHFTSAQQYDFVVTPVTGGTPLWRWSADRGFATGLTSRTLAPGEHWIVTETWRPTARGTLMAQGVLTSSTHFVSAVTPIVVP